MESILKAIFLAALGSGALLVAGKADEVAEAYPPALSPRLLPDCGGHRSWLSERGLEYSVTYIGEVLGAVSGGYQQGTIYEGLLKAQLDFDSNGPLPDYEMVIKATYRAALGPGLDLQPVVGYVIHPGGAPGHDAPVIGLRSSLNSLETNRQKFP